MDRSGKIKIIDHEPSEIHERGKGALTLAALTLTLSHEWEREKFD